MQDFGMVIPSGEPLGQWNICLSDSHFDRVRDEVWRGYRDLRWNQLWERLCNPCDVKALRFFLAFLHLCKVYSNFAYILPSCCTINHCRLSALDQLYIVDFWSSWRRIRLLVGASKFRVMQHCHKKEQ